LNRTPIRVLVASGDPKDRARLSSAAIKSERVELAGEAESVGRVGQQLSTLKPDVVLLAVGAEQADAMALIKAVVRHPLRPRVLLISDSYSGSTVYEAVRLGARGAIRHGSNGAAIREAIAAVARGELVLDSREQAALGQELRLRGGCEVPRLTGRERQALALAEQGLTTEYIAHRLNVSPSTIRTYFERSYKKLGVPNKTAAVAKAIRNGWLGVSAPEFVVGADDSGWQDLISAASALL
jgi:DNA-binding NarL/FixJ family response regulator